MESIKKIDDIIYIWIICLITKSHKKRKTKYKAGFYTKCCKNKRFKVITLIDYNQIWVEEEHLNIKKI